MSMWYCPAPRLGGALLAAGLLLLGSPLLRAAEPPAAFTLRDFLGRTWRNERVSFPLTAAQKTAAGAGRPLLGPNGAPVLYQLVPGATPPQPTRLAFLTDLDPYETRAYRFGPGKVQVPTDLVVEETPQLIRLTNRLFGVEIPKTPAGGGPLGRVRLRSGQWVGGSFVKGQRPLESYSARITARGPVYAEVLCRASWGDQGTWEVRFQLQAREPVLRVDETCALTGPADWLLFPDQEWGADRLLYRFGKGDLGRNALADLPTLPAGPVFTLEPWCRWANQEREGSCFSLLKGDTDDLLSLGAGWAGAWVDPALPGAQQAPPWVDVVKGDRGLSMTLPIKRGQRRWIVSSLSRQETLAEMSDQAPYKSLLPFRYTVKHGQFPLDPIKDYVLTWKGDHDNYPRLLLTKATAARFRQNVTDPAPYLQAIPTYLTSSAYQFPSFNQFNMSAPLEAWFATGDPALGKLLGERANQMLERAIAALVEQEGTPFGSAPHHLQIIGASVLLADAALSNPQLDPALRERLLGQIAFLGYTVARPDYWSPVRGYGGTPNMSTSVYGYQATIACAVPTHPLARAWVKEGMDQLYAQLKDWSDAAGGWLEAPHYAMVSMDQILACFVMAHNAGFNDYLYDPQVRQVLNWFSQIATPPDSRLQGHRHHPAAGHTYVNEPTGEFGLAAGLFREKDPEFAAQMQWMFRQQWSFPEPGVGGGYPGFAGFRTLLVDPSIQEKAPPWKSVWFPQTGVVLRNVFPHERETYLYMIAGNNHYHYDDDSGNVILWGKGRILADEFGYYVPARADHSMPDTPLASGLMQIREFTPAERLDYVRGQAGGWSRQVAFVKDPDPLGPNYFVFCDSFTVSTPAVWRLWLTASGVTPARRAASVVGKEDVDTDVFFALPAEPQLKTEEGTRRSNAGCTPEGRSAAIDTTQICLSAQPPRTPVFTVAVYPRLKSERAPVFTAFAEGRGLQVDSPAGTDYVLLSATPFTCTEGDLQFEGTCGLVQVRGDQVRLALGSPGRLVFRGQTLAQGTVAPPPSANQLRNGDFESGVQDLFPAAGYYDNLPTTLFAGNPVPGDATHAGKSCAQLTLTTTSSATGMSQPLYVDPTRKFRLAVTYYSAGKFNATFGGYSQGPGGQLKDAAGNVWQWSIGLQGPTEGWKTAEITVGPPGSGAACTWPPQAVSTGMTLWISGDLGTKVYLDDLVFEPVP